MHQIATTCPFAPFCRFNGFVNKERGTSEINQWSYLIHLYGSNQPILDLDTSICSAWSGDHADIKFFVKSVFLKNDLLFVKKLLYKLVKDLIKHSKLNLKSGPFLTPYYIVSKKCWPLIREPESIKAKVSKD